MGEPFLFDEVFAINRDLDIDSAGFEHIPAVLIDGARRQDTRY